MKVQNILRMQAIVIGLGAALFLASPAPAQEIANTEFPDGPYVTSFQPTTTIVDSAATPAAPAFNVEAAAVSHPMPVIAEGTASTFSDSEKGWLLVACLFGAAMLAIYAMSKVRRATLLRTARRTETWG